ncbi:MAG: caspase family protein [Syntrophales bacterium]|nr:caspase family protein [Syntrophales bacterium]
MNGKCESAEKYTRDRIMGGLLAMIKANENTQADICTLGDDGETCEKKGIRWYVQGGPFPGIASYSEPYIFQATFDKKTAQIKFMMDGKGRWLGPLLCASAPVTVSVISPTNVIMESSPVCSWLFFPGAYYMKFTINSLDFDKSVISGSYSVAGAGLLNIGGGSNLFRMEFKKKNALVSKDGGLAVLPPLESLPADVFVLAVPGSEGVVEKKEETTEEEKRLWENVSRENSISSYKRYLELYPKGMFQGAAKARIQALEEREIIEQDVAYWGRIKDSKNAADFDSYIERFPKGLFVDMAVASAKRLRAATSVLGELEVEEALWEKVRDSKDPEEVRKYLHRYPLGIYADQAKRRIDNLLAVRDRHDNLELRLWKKIENSRNIEDYKNYLQMYPDGLFADLAKSRIDVLLIVKTDTEEMVFWNSIRESSRPEDFREYLRRYPKGRYTDLAKMLEKQLEALKAERDEIEFWETVKDSRKLEDFVQYLQKYPKGRYAEIAKQRHDELLRIKEGANIDFGNYYALVIGIDEYKHLRKLRTARRDAEAVGALLDKEYGYGVVLLINATRKQIMDAFSKLRKSLTQRDNLLIYYAGHGYLDRDTGRGYWLPADADADSVANWISTNDISDALKAMAAKHVIVVADSCYSGTLTRGVTVTVKGSDYLRRLAEKRTRVVLTSGGVEPVLDEGGEGHSVFARLFIDVLNKNRGIMEGTRLFEELRKLVATNAPQTPEYSDLPYVGHEGGDFLFVHKQFKMLSP